MTALYDAQRHNPNEPFSIGVIARAVHAEPGEVVEATNLLAQQGHAHVHESLNSVNNSVQLSASGMSLGSDWTTRRSDSAERRRACRAALLDVLNRDDDEFRALALADDPRAAFFGDPFSDLDITKALRTLRERTLIESMDSAQVDFIRVRITEDGRDCSERYGGNVDAWLDRGESKGGDTITNTFTNSPGAQAQTNSPGGQQSSTVTITTDARQQLLTIADQIIENLAALDLDDVSRAEAATAARDLRHLADQPNADKGRARALLGVIATSAAGAVGTAGGQALMHLVSDGVQAITG